MLFGPAVCSALQGIGVYFHVDGSTSGDGAFCPARRIGVRRQ
jgi:hypothetical protein